MLRARHPFAGAALVALVLATGAGSSTRDDLTPPTLLEPVAGQAIQAGTHVVFRIRTHPGDGYLWLKVSRSPTPVESCGVIGFDADIERFTATSDASVYEARPSYFSYADFWMNKVGTYYWQAYRIEYGSGADGCIESEIRPLRIVASAEPAPTPTPTPTPTPKPTPTAKPLSTARLAGQFTLKQRLTSVSGLEGSKRGDTSTTYWTFKPLCTTGACAVRLVIPPGLFGGKTSQIKLAKSGTMYRGAGTAYLTTCSVKAVAGSLSVKLNVTAGAWIDGRWRATRVAGTMSYSTPSTTWSIYRCKAASFTATVRGPLEG